MRGGGGRACCDGGTQLDLIEPNIITAWNMEGGTLKPGGKNLEGGTRKSFSMHMARIVAEVLAAVICFSLKGKKELLSY